MAITKAQKQRLIRQFKSLSDERLESLVRESNTICNSCENKINRRVNKVSVTLWDVKLKHILEVERHHKPTMKGLLKDVEEVKRGEKE